MLVGLITGLLGLAGKAADRLLPDRNKSIAQHQEINKSLASHASIAIALSVALSRYVVSFLVIYVIAAAFFGLPVPDEVGNMFSLLLPVLGL